MGADFGLGGVSGALSSRFIYFSARDAAFRPARDSDRRSVACLPRPAFLDVCRGAMGVIFGRLYGCPARHLAALFGSCACGRRTRHAARLCGLARESARYSIIATNSPSKCSSASAVSVGFDFWPFLKGVTRGECALHLPSKRWQEIAEEYARRRRQHRKVRLAWRRSGGTRRSLGWIPFKVRTIRYRGRQVYFRGTVVVALEQLRSLRFELRAGCFTKTAADAGI